MASGFYGGEAELNLFTSGEPHPAMLQYAREQAQAIGNYIQRTGNVLAQNVIQAYDAFYSDNALHHARVAMSRVKSYFQEDKVQALTSIYDIQQAQPVMQRFIMAEPMIAKMYDQGRCEGYPCGNPFPGQYGESNYNYRRVMDGLLQFTEPDEDSPEGGFQFVIYGEELMEGDRNLILPQQKAILDTWESMRYSLARSMIDPVSPSGKML